MLKKSRLLTRQPWRAETRLVPSKAAASEETRRTLRYVEPLSDARTPLADFFSILLEQIANGLTSYGMPKRTTSSICIFHKDC
jgi:hypothetical protein